MSKYFIDCEFIEGTQTPSFFLKGRLGNWIGAYKKPTIDLISIGIVSEDNREYYAISKDFNLDEAWNRFDIKEVNGDQRNHYPNGVKVYWIRDNVLFPIWVELWCEDKNLDFKMVNTYKTGTAKDYSNFNYKVLKQLINKYGKTNKQIAEEIKEFVNGIGEDISVGYGDKEFYGYYADYDWVVFCWLFGKMIDLPKGFPMYCIDLKQELDNKVDIIRKPTDLTIEQMLETIKGVANYPKQTNEHNALDDAKWNFELYKFIQTL